MIRVELAKLIGRPRTWVAVGLLCALQILVAIFLAVTHVAPAHGKGPAFVSAVLDNGTLYPAAPTAMITPIFLTLAIAVVAGTEISGEAATGNLRYLQLQQVGR